MLILLYHTDILLALKQHRGAVCTAGKQLLSPNRRAPSIEILIKRLAEFHLSVTTPLFPNDKTVS